MQNVLGRKGEKNEKIVNIYANRAYTTVIDCELYKHLKGRSKFICLFVFSIQYKKLNRYHGFGVMFTP